MPDQANALPAVDRRYREQRHPDQVFAFPVYTERAAWEQRAAWLRQHLLAVLGLWPLPEQHALDAQVVGSIRYDDYVVERVHFESWPGFYCAGNLYRPLGRTAPWPAILNPHGHWERGRLAHEPLGSIRARCVTFARMGMLAFSYDMVGYNDSLQVPRHRFATMRGALWGVSPMALQTWNSMRAVDYLLSLPGIDPRRIGCTGESGGGTQTYMLAAVDERIAVAAPVNMVSAHFQGGCVCENAPGLRTDTYNVEIAALMAPRPLLLVSATGDWTANTPAVEFPDVRSIYRLYGAEERVATVQVDAPHNYNAESREHVYRWFARWFLGEEAAGRGAEREFAVEPDERLRVFPDGALPAGALTGLGLAEQRRDMAMARLDRLRLETPTDLRYLQQVTRTRLGHVLGAEPVPTGRVVVEPGPARDGEGWCEAPLALGRRGQGDRVAGCLYTPCSSVGAPRRMVVVAHGAGRAGVQDDYGDLVPLLTGFLAERYEVLALDLLYTGAIPDDALLRRDGDWFYATFNRPLLGERVQDLLVALAWAAARPAEAEPLLVGLGGAGPWVLLAAALSPTDCAVWADMQGLDVAHEESYLGDLHAPALCAYGGLEVAAALVAPRPLMLANTADRFPLDWVMAAYAAADCREALTAWPGWANPVAWVRDLRSAPRPGAPGAKDRRPRRGRQPS